MSQSVVVGIRMGWGPRSLQGHARSVGWRGLKCWHQGRGEGDHRGSLGQEESVADRAPGSKG